MNVATKVERTIANLVSALDALSLAAYGVVNAPGIAKYQEAFEAAQVQARAAMKNAEAT